MNKLHFSIVIDAPVDRVWNTMLDDDTYRQWTEAFTPGSHYVGEWKPGSKILFLGPDEKGRMGGMVSRIKELDPYRFVSIEHVGVVHDGKEDTTSEAVKGWAGALENYTFKQTESGTELLIEMDSHEDYAEMFQDMWPKALRKLKELSETENTGKK
jgi:uncharacterized protein YndB with AHSA1/START domain